MSLTFRVGFGRPWSAFRRNWAGLLCTLFLLPRLLSAQTELRPSTIGGLLDPQIPPVNPDYNLKLGPVDVLFTAGLQTQFNDNISLTQNNPTSDIILTPQFTIGMFWQLTPYNSIRLNTTIGYMRYLSHPDFRGSSNPITISPDSEISYNIFLGAFVVNFHDRFEFAQDPVTEPSVANVTNLGRFINTAGLGITWNPSQVLSFKVDYDHTDLIPQSSSADFEAYSEDQLSLSAQAVIEPWISAGLEGSVASTRYRTSGRPDALSSNVGPFIDLSLSSFTHLRLAGGWQGIFFQENGDTPEVNSEALQLARALQSLSPDLQAALIRIDPALAGLEAPLTNATPQDQNTYYFNVELTNNLTTRTRQSLSFGRESQLGITTASENDYFLRYDIGTNLNDFVSVHLSAFFTRGTTFGLLGEHFTQDGVELSSAFRFNKHFSGALSYRYAHRTSNVDLMSYDQNVVSLSLDYHF